VLAAWQDDQVALVPSLPVRSARLVLRRLVPADAAAVAAYRSVPEVCRYVPFEPMDAAAVTARIEGPWASPALRGDGDAVTLGVERADTGEVIGDLMLRWLSAEHAGGEIGYVFSPAQAGLGFATEAAHAALHIAFGEFGLHRVIARLDVRNTASARLAARLGMRQEAHLVQNEWFKGEWTDELDFAMLAGELPSHRLPGCPVCG
jgi:RimJ/RimL family protein N-acetyltransferase